MAAITVHTSRKRLKEKRWVVFKGEEDPTSLPAEWICWLNGQRKRAPTPELGFSSCGGGAEDFENSYIFKKRHPMKMDENKRFRKRCNISVHSVACIN
uniref:Uncharacterized protein n=1 Tax=Salix viminalis TaxID=40686 RepID=A0A6N2M1H5_SALVM